MKTDGDLLQMGEALYVISIASRLVEMHPATLRKYERAGFLEPSRSHGNIRLYSHADIARLRQIKYLVEERGLNLAGVELALGLTRLLERLSAHLEQEAPSRNGRDGPEPPRDLVRQALSLLGSTPA